MGFLFSNHGKVGSVLNSSGLSCEGQEGLPTKCQNIILPASSPAKVNGIRDVEVPVSMFLPHEVLHSLATCDCAVLFRSIMFGNRDPREIKKFWDHVRQLAPWKDHPVLQDPSQDFGRLIALQFHADGAEIYRDDEYFIYSFSSIFGSGLVTDVLLHRFPLVFVAERHMQQNSVPCFTLARLFSPTESII